MNFDGFIDKYKGQTKGYPTDEYYKGQCLSIIKIFIKECFGISPPPSGTNSAYGYWSNFPDPLGTVFTKVLNYKDTIPEKGWIVIWKPWTGNIYGHIALCDDGCTKSKLINWAQNWTSKAFQKETNNYDNVVGYLKPSGTISEMDPILQFIKDNNITEGQLREGFAYVKDQTVPKLEKKVKELEEKQADLEKKIVELETKYTQKEELELSYQSSIKTANSKLAKSFQNLKDMQDERDDWRKRYNDKNTEYNNLQETIKEKANNMVKKKTFWEILKLLFKKLWPSKK